MPPTHLQNRQDAEEFLSSFRVARINLSVPAAITFRAGEKSGLAVSWEAWLEGTFRPLLAPAFMATYEAVKAPELAVVLAADAHLEEKLSSEFRESSCAAGEELFLALEGARHLGVPARYRTAVLEGKSPGHFTVALAARCSAFHVPPVAALFGFCYLEWFGGRLALHGAGRQSGFLSESGSALKHCKEAALAAPFSEFHLA